MGQRGSRHNVFKRAFHMFLGALHFMPPFANALQGKSNEAEPFFRRSLRIMEQTRGSYFLAAATDIINRASILQAKVRSKGYFRAFCVTIVALNEGVDCFDFNMRAILSHLQVIEVHVNAVV